MSLIEQFALDWPPHAWQDVHVAIALSGGADSVALLRATLDLKRQVGGKGEIFALHVNHQLRGQESEGDADWCAGLCRRLGVSLQVLRGNVAARAALEGDGLESAAREERYTLLTTAAGELGARYLATAHTRDDNIETMLFRLLRGTGLRGLRGIATTRMLSPSLTAVRPLLSCARHDVVEYLAALGQDFRTDSSNASRDFTRNRIRAELLPLLRADYNSNVDDAIERLADQASEMYEFVETKARELLGTASATASDGELTLQVSALSGKPLVVVREVVRIAWREAKLPEQAMTHDWWCQLADLAAGGASGVVLNLPGNVRASVLGDVLVVRAQ